MTNWRELIVDAMGVYGEDWADVVASTLSPTEELTPFDTGFGGSEGVPFTVWTAKRVYFPAVYDGAEWVASVSRNPDGQPTPHVGGE